MNRVTWIGGPILASLIAGPVFTLALAATALAVSPWDSGTPLVGWGMILAFSFPVGFVLALIPNFAGAALMAWSGSVSSETRRPIVWGAVGGTIGWLIGLSLLGSVTGVPLSATGIICALICRKLVSWPD